MATTKIKYSPSIHIIRDSKYVFNYIPTRNATQAFTSILNDTLVGIKSHVLIGSFGTGKSSFLLSLQQTLEGTHPHFKGFQKLINSLPKFEFLPIVGEYASLENLFAKRYNLGKGYTTSDIIKALDKEYKQLKKKGKGLAILIDEFGKFLEYAAQHRPESELYFIQQLAEWINDTENDTLLITTLHQNFSAYALHLNKVQRQEWDKVKGRLKEVAFNEPVEQLLLLAAERIDEKFANKTLDKNFDKLFNTIKESNSFPLRDYFDKGVAQKLYPFDMLSAAVLTLSLQKYGQNERSLFSFIESRDHLGINEFNTKEKSFYSIPQVYDYLLNGYYTFITSKENLHYIQWSGIRSELEKVEGLFEDRESQRSAEQIIKTIGLLNIYASAGAKLGLAFYLNYCKWALGIKNPEEIFEILDKKKKIIKYAEHNSRYIFREGTDLDIELAINEAGQLVEKVTHVVHHLNQYFDFPFISAKAAYYEKGTPRFFQFKLSEEPINQAPEGEVDGFINLIFTEDTRMAKKLEEFSATCEEAILFGYYKNTAEIRNILYEIQKIKKVKENNGDDKVALKELDGIQDHNIRLLNHYVLNKLYADDGNVSWFYKGKKLKIVNRQKFNQELSRICAETYPSTPVYQNELINKVRVSGQVALARNKLLKKFLTDLDKPNLGFEDNEFPPEKSIYLSLVRGKGIHQLQDGVGTLEQPTDPSFDTLWEAGFTFLHSTRTKERNLQEFIDILSARPFKLKQGFIDFWIPMFLIAQREEFALYESGVYIPDITDDILELMNKKPGLFSIKAFDVAGIKLQLFNRYRALLNQAEQNRPTNKVFIQTIKPFLTFYRDLPEYSKKTQRLDKKTLALRTVIAGSRDPEKTFFEEFPTALGYSLTELQKSQQQAEAFITRLQQGIRELRTAYDALIDRFEQYFIQDVIGSKESFPAYREEITQRFRKVKTHLLLARQRPFFNRLQSELDDRKAWLSAIAQACIDKPLTSITDEEERVLYDRLSSLIYELDNLSEVSISEVDDQKEDVLKVEITSYVQGLNSRLLRIPKEKVKEVDEKMLEIRRFLSKDKKLNLAILTKLLQEQIENE